MWVRTKEIQPTFKMNRFTKLIVVFSVLTTFSTPAFARNKYGYPRVQSREIPNCYMITQNRIKLDLMRLCGGVTITPANSNVKTGATSSGGNCPAGRGCSPSAVDKQPASK